MSETKLCPSWQANQLCLSLEEVLTHNFLLHQLYCERNIVKCEFCDERIDQSEKQIHMLTHQKVECKYCQENYEKRLLENHMSICHNRPEKCEYCQLPFNRLDMVQHQAKCGSRTEFCQLCKKHIQKKEFDIHQIECKQPSPPKRKRLQKITSDHSEDSNSDSSSVQEIKPKQQRPQQPQQQRRPPQTRRPPVQKKESKLPTSNDQFQVGNDFDEEDEEFQKAIQMICVYVLERGSSIVNSLIQFTKLLDLNSNEALVFLKIFYYHQLRRKSCHCKECGNMTNFQYRNMNIPLILKPSRFGRQQSIRCNRLLTVKNTKKLFRKYSATRQDTLVSPSSSQLILTTLRRASARSTDRLIEDTHVRIVEPPKSCRSHLIANPLKDEIKNITLTIPKSQRIIKTLPSETQKIKLLPSIQSMTRIYTRNFLSCYLNKYKKSKTHMSLQKIC